MNIKDDKGYIMMMTIIALFVMSIHSIHLMDGIYAHQHLLEEMITYVFH